MMNVACVPVKPLCAANGTTVRVRLKLVTPACTKWRVN